MTHPSRFITRIPAVVKPEEIAVKLTNLFSLYKLQWGFAPTPYGSTAFDAYTQGRGTRTLPADVVMRAILAFEKVGIAVAGRFPVVKPSEQIVGTLSAGTNNLRINVAPQEMSTFDSRLDLLTLNPHP